MSDDDPASWMLTGMTVGGTMDGFVRTADNSKNADAYLAGVLLHKSENDVKKGGQLFDGSEGAYFAGVDFGNCFAVILIGATVAAAGFVVYQLGTGVYELGEYAVSQFVNKQSKLTEKTILQNVGAQGRSARSMDPVRKESFSELPAKNGEGQVQGRVKAERKPARPSKKPTQTRKPSSRRLPSATGAQNRNYVLDTDPSSSTYGQGVKAGQGARPQKPAGAASNPKRDDLKKHLNFSKETSMNEGVREGLGINAVASSRPAFSVSAPDAMGYRTIVLG